MMATNKLVPNDPRVQSATAEIRGKTYKYTLSQAEVSPIATMVLIHGFPDLGFGWRYQVPYFTSLGFRVLVPDMLGYGGTDAPEALEEYTLKSISADIRELVQKVVGPGQIILGGHDWGGAFVWRMAMWYPEMIQGVFSICTPYNAPSSTFVSLENIIASGNLLNFRYQLQFKGPEVEANIRGEEKVRQFLNGMYGGAGPNREKGFTAEEGILLDNLSLLKRTKLLSEDELSYYTQQYLLQKDPQLRGPLNWYRTRELNFQDELPLTEKGTYKLKMPALFITATEDTALPPSMSLGMEQRFDNLTRGEVQSSHWALWQASDEVNRQVAKWADVVLNGSLKPAL
ncbi:hypothetical protein G7046_g9176 [Stylonectria norvegica]|nr:hypothetical protein G7046_g9176 [Stylonectria norvegica]